MSKFIGLMTYGNESVIVNIDSISCLEVNYNTLRLNSGCWIKLNNNSTKVLLEILMENEYKMEVEAE